MNAIERLLDIVAFLLAARRPVPPRDLFEAFAGEYAGTEAARERKFTRDKEELRTLGVPIEYVEPDDEQDGGYRIDRGRMYLPDIALRPDEKAGLFAVGAAALEAGMPLAGELAHGLAKLRATQGGEEEHARPVLYTASGRRSPFEELLVRAVAERRQLVLTYPPEKQARTVDPYVVAQRRGRVTLVGKCHLRQAIRTFHADRMTSCELARPAAKAGEFEVPADFDATPHLPRHAWQLQHHPPLTVTLAFAPELVVSGPQALGILPGEPCVTTNLDGLVSEVLALGSGVRIVAPPEARARVRAKLAKIRGEAA